MFTALLLVAATSIAYSNNDFYTSHVKADIEIAEMRRSVLKILNDSHKSQKQKQESLIDLESKLNRDYAGKDLKWQVMLVKAIQQAERTADVAVPGWVVGSIGKQVQMSAGSTTKYYVVSIRLNNVPRSTKRGEFLVLSATVKGIHINLADGVSVSMSLANGSVSPLEQKEQKK